MAKKKQAKKVSERVYYEGDKNKVIEKPIGSYTQKGSLEFAKNINIKRQVPEVIDGLKPVHRRIVYAMFRMGLKPSGATKKSSQVSGIVMGEYHPHGDGSIYETISKLAQPWKTPIPLITLQGGLGNSSGDKAAAPRYTEVKLSEYAWYCFFKDYNKNSVQMKLNYLGTDYEPERLPSRYPNILINTQMGIGYGESTEIPSYNFGEIVNVTKKLMKDPKAKVSIVPDIPSGCDIISDGEFKKIFETGMGKFTMRGEVLIDTENNTVTIFSLPLRIKLTSFVAKVQELISKKVITEVISYEDNSKDLDIELTFHMRKGADLYAFRQLLFDKTKLSHTYASNLNVIDDYIGYKMSVRDVLLRWIDARREYKVLYYNAQYKDLREAIHITEIILRITKGKNGEKVVGIIRDAENNDDAAFDLIGKFGGMTSLQAQKIVRMRLSNFSKSGIRKLVEAKEAAEIELERIEPLVNSNLDVIDAIIESELDEGIKKFDRPRKSNVITIDNEITIQNSEHKIVLSHGGIIKKIEDDSESVGELPQGDKPSEVLNVSNLDNLLIFDEGGNAFKLPVHDIPTHDLRSHGQPIKSFIKSMGKVVRVIVMPTSTSKAWTKSNLIFVTENGLIKKTDMELFKDIRTELIAINIKDGDNLKAVEVISHDKDVLVYTTNGKGGYFNSEEISNTGRNSMGVKSIDMVDGDKICGLSVFQGDETSVLIVTDDGMCKRCTLEAFPRINRAGKPYQLVKLDNNELKYALPVVGNEKAMFLLSDEAKTYDVAGFSQMTRLSKGKKQIPVKKGDTIIDILLN